MNFGEYSMRTIVLIVATLIFWGCSSDEAGDTVGQEIADDYNAALDKAADVENQLLEQKEKMDQALQDAQNSAEDP